MAENFEKLQQLLKAILRHATSLSCGDLGTPAGCRQDSLNKIVRRMSIGCIPGLGQDQYLNTEATWPNSGMRDQPANAPRRASAIDRALIDTGFPHQQTMIDQQAAQGDMINGMALQPFIDLLFAIGRACLKTLDQPC